MVEFEVKEDKLQLTLKITHLESGGYLLAHTSWDYVEVFSVSVPEAYQRQGIGFNLIKRANDFALTKRVEKPDVSPKYWPPYPIRFTSPVTQAGVNLMLTWFRYHIYANTVKANRGESYYDKDDGVGWLEIDGCKVSFNWSEKWGIDVSSLKLETVNGKELDLLG